MKKKDIQTALKLLEAFHAESVCCRHLHRDYSVSGPAVRQCKKLNYKSCGIEVCPLNDDNKPITCVSECKHSRKVGTGTINGRVYTVLYECYNEESSAYGMLFTNRKQVCVHREVKLY